MSAAVAGCNAIYLHPFKHEADDFSSRITLNIHHLLKEEAYLEAVNNPADGSYLIDNYTDQLATDAWKEFLLIENSGGLLRNLESGALQKRIELQAEEELKTVLSNQKTILGVNKHRRKDEKVNERPEKVEKKEGSFDVKPLKPYRLAAHLNA